MDFGWKARVKPPRLGGNKKIGVLATRSTFRPNPIGMSAIKLDKVEVNNETRLHISGLDLLDQTPVLDIKPYIPYSDSILDTAAGFAEIPPDADHDVDFSEQAISVITQYGNEVPALKQLIEQVLQQDPRPAYRKHKPDDKIYGMALYNLNIQFQFTTLRTIYVVAITPVG